MEYPIEKYTLPTDYQSYIVNSRYSRWLDDEQRREIWPEPVVRYVENVVRPVLEKAKVENVDAICLEAFDYIASCKVMPSMRALMTAGEALDRDHMAGFNCSFVAVDSPRAFDEILYILTCGTGVGFSCEQEFINKLPDTAETYHETDTTIVVADSRIGWASSFRELISLLYSGKIPKIDVSRVRKKGERLRTFGGRASGPEPLVDLFEHCIRTFRNAAGRKLNSLEVHSIVCKIGEIVVVGGVRRCLPEGSLVHTQRGLVRIEDVRVGEDQAFTPYGLRKIVNLFDQGEQETIRIKTQTGVFECTANHRMAVLDGPYGQYIWKQAGELDEGDRLIFSAQETPGVQTKLPLSNYTPSERAYTAKPITIPELDTEMAWFIGYFQANGHSAIRHTTPTKRNSAVSVSIPNDADDVKEAVVRNLGRFGVNVRVRAGCGECVSVRATSVELALWLQEHIKQSNVEFFVPDFILQSTPAIRSAYIAGIMDGDGSVSSRPIQIMSCVHEGYLKQLQALCASLGFATRVHCNRPERGNWKALHRILLKGSKQERVFYSTVGAYLKYKIEEPRTRKKEMFSFSIPSRMVKDAAKEHRAQYHQNYNVNCPVDLWEKIVGETFPWTPVEVLGIERGEEVQTWDIEVEDVHQFYCNGYLTHNSALISLSDLNDPRMRHAKSGQWWVKHPEFALANNSAVYSEKPDTGVFLEEWKALYDSKSGERGIYNRDGIRRKVKASGKRDESFVVGTNPLNLAA